MADNPAGVRIVEIRAGNSQRPVLELRPGEAVQPMSIGRVGMWPIDAPGVLDVHVYVYFDGRVLFLQSADTSNPAKGNGQAIGGVWQQIEIPCTIEIGRARLVYRTLEEDAESDEDKTVAQPIRLPDQLQFRPGGGAFSNRQQVDDEATRLAPAPREPNPTVVGPLEVAGPPVPKARPAAGMPAAMTQPQGWPPNAGMPRDIAPISATTVGPAPAPPPPQTGYQAFGSVQVAVPAPPPAPNPAMMGPGMAMQPMPMMQGPGPGGSGPMPMMGGSGPYAQMLPPMGPGGSAETSRLQPELTGFAKAKAEWNAMPPLRKLIIGTFPGVALLVYFMLFDDQPPPPQPRRPVPSASAGNSAAPSASIALIATATTPTATVTATTPTATITATVAPPASVAPLPKGKKTLEREAIDLAAAGQYAKAAEIYDQLSAAHPDKPAFREAARLLRLRINNP